MQSRISHPAFSGKAVVTVSKISNKVWNSQVTKSSYETKSTQNDVTLRVTNSKIFIEIPISSY